MRLATLIDLETQLLRDEERLRQGDGATVAERDRRIGPGAIAELGVEPDAIAARLDREPLLRQRLAEAWLARLGPEADRLPGTRIEAGYRLLIRVLVVLAAIAGFGAAAGVLAYDGSRPVNVLSFLGVFVLLQLFLLSIGPAVVVLRSWRGRDTRLAPWWVGLLARVGRARWVSATLGESGRDLPARLATLSSRHALYARVEQWTLFALLQRCSIAFNVTALATCLYLITFTDLAFGWSTTLDVEPAELHSWLEWLASPWSPWLGEPVTLDVVQHSQWDRMARAYVGGASIEQALRDADRWWRLLVCALLTYGLLPRVAALAFGAWQTRRSSRALRLDHVAFEHLFERLLPAGTRWSGPEPDAVRGEAPPPATALRTVDAAAAARPCTLVCWGRLLRATDAVRAGLEGRRNRRIDRVLGAGQSDLATDHETIASIRRDRPARALLAIEEGQPPTREIIRFVRELRQALGTSALLSVAVVAIDGDTLRDVGQSEQRPWRDKLAAEHDPYLALETVEAP